MRRSFRPGVVEIFHPRPDVPDPLKNGRVVETCMCQQVTTSGELTKWLLDRGLGTGDWGIGHTKGVGELLAEIATGEAGLELWRKADGELQPVRVVHVLRAKVCSPESRECGVFLLNTWQQSGDGCIQTCKGLLSKRLMMSEVPLEKSLHAACQRAVTREEMQRLTGSMFKIGPTCPAPPFDPRYACPLEVVDEYLDDYVVEVEASESYPRLLTLSHLYTVDVLCTGLPVVDFNTLVFDRPDEHGTRELRCVRAWVWTKWSQMQRSLFEGSSMKECRAKGSFSTPDHLRAWLQSFNLDLSAWGQAGFEPVEGLFRELEENEAQLEVWGRPDGVPLLMRAVHMLQLKICSVDPRLRDKFLCNTRVQTPSGESQSVSSLMLRKLRLPCDRQRFSAEARAAIREGLTYCVDSFCDLRAGNLPEVAGLERQLVEVKSVELLEHLMEVEESPTFGGLCTLYHLYECRAVCDGLPLADFASLEVKSERPGGSERGAARPSVTRALGWCWISWPQCLDMAHSSTRRLERRLALHQDAWEAQSRILRGNTKVIEKLAGLVSRLVLDRHLPADTIRASQALLSQVRDGHQDLMRLVESQKTSADCCKTARDRPAMGLSTVKLLPAAEIELLSPKVEPHNCCRCA